VTAPADESQQGGDPDRHGRAQDVLSAVRNEIPESLNDEQRGNQPDKRGDGDDKSRRAQQPGAPLVDHDHRGSTQNHGDAHQHQVVHGAEWYGGTGQNGAGPLLRALSARTASPTATAGRIMIGRSVIPERMGEQ
jgi:hypothetical protein